MSGQHVLAEATDLHVAIHCELYEHVHKKYKTAPGTHNASL